MKNVAFESSGLSCSLLWTVSVGISFTVCLGRPVPRHHHRKRFCHPSSHPNHHLKQNVLFHRTWEEWEKLSGLDSPTLLCQRPEQQKQEHHKCEQRDPTRTTHPRSDSLFFVCHSRSDLADVGRHHHHAHTPHLALPLVSLPPLFSHSMSPLPCRFRMTANSTIICSCVLC